MNFSKWISRSLLGHVVFFALIFSLPASIYGVVSNYGQGTFAIEMIFAVTALGVIGAVAVWYTIASPIIRRKRRPSASRNPEEIHGPCIQFLREEDGVPERALKDQLVALFQLTERVHRAYLARARVGDQEVVVLCLKAVSGAERELVSQIGATFARIFNTREHLDIMFLDDPQEADLGRVCKAFFTAPLCEQESEI